MLLLLALLGCTTPTEAPVAPPPPPAEPAPEAPEAPASPAHRLDVRALSWPVGWLAERIGGDRVRVTVVAPADQDPATWRPTPELVAGLASADLLVANGAGYEAWTATATLPDDKVVRTADGLDLIRREGVTHSHGKQGAHSHAGVDPHTFGDPTLLLAQAKAIADALAARDPEGKPAYDAALAQLDAAVRKVDADLGAALAGAKSRKLAASHPSFEYLARHEGLDLTSFALDPAAPTSASDRRAVEAWAATAGPEPILLWEAPPTAAAIASLPAGLQHVPLDPLERPGADGRYDWLRQEEANVAVLRRLFESAAPSPAPAGSPPTTP